MPVLPRLRIRNWGKFQHYSYRRPPWVKLYRELLDDKEWHNLSGESAKGLIMLWLIASEEDGYLPDSTTLAFRLRISENRAIALLSDCSHWIETDASMLLAECYQDATPEKSRDRVREEKTFRAPKSGAPELGSTEFRCFWDQYPRKESRKKALAIWVRKSLDSQLGEILAGLESWKKVREPSYMPYAQGWLTQESWKETPIGGANGARQSVTTGATRAEKRVLEADKQAERVFGRSSGLVASLRPDLSRRPNGDVGSGIQGDSAGLGSSDTARSLPESTKGIPAVPPNTRKDL